MKKTRYLFKLLSMLVIIALTAPLASCLNDDIVEQEGERGLIIMNLSGDTRAAGDVLFLDDERIEKVRFLVFVNGVVEIGRAHV